MRPCNKAIALLMDRSSSINNEDWVHQVEATANAIEDPEVMGLILSNGGVAFRAMAFSGWLTPIVEEWHLLSTEAEIRNFAAKLRDFVSDMKPHNQVTSGSTEMSAGLNEASRSLMRTLPPSCQFAKPIIDITTDGEPNDSDVGQTAIASQDAARRGITINGIAIGGQRAYDALDDYVVTKENGGKTFHADWKNFKEVIKEKLLMELLADAGIERRSFSPQQQTEPESPATTPAQSPYRAPELRKAG